MHSMILLGMPGDIPSRNILKIGCGEIEPGALLLQQNTSSWDLHLDNNFYCFNDLGVLMLKDMSCASFSSVSFSSELLATLLLVQLIDE